MDLACILLILAMIYVKLTLFYEIDLLVNQNLTSTLKIDPTLLTYLGVSIDLETLIVI